MKNALVQRGTDVRIHVCIKHRKMNCHVFGQILAIITLVSNCHLLNGYLFGGGSSNSASQSSSGGGGGKALLGGVSKGLSGAGEGRNTAKSASKSDGQGESKAQGSSSGLLGGVSKGLEGASQGLGKKQKSFGFLVSIMKQLRFLIIIFSITRRWETEP